MTSGGTPTLRVTAVTGAAPLDLVLCEGGKPNIGFRELVEVRFHGPPSSEAWVLTVDDEPLTRDLHGVWRWSPGSFAGLVEARLRTPTGSEWRFVLDVASDPAKLGRASFDELLEAVRAVDPTLISGVEPAQAATGTLGEFQDPWLEFRRLRRHASVFLAGLERIAARPVRNLVRTRRLVSLRSARRVDLATVTAAAAGGSLAMLAGVGVDSDVRAEPVFDVPWVQQTLDGAANRCVTALLLAVLRRTRALARVLADIVERESHSETRSALAPRWPVRRAFLDELDRSLERMLRREPFCEVTHPEISAAGLTAVAANPDHAGAYSAGWKCLRSGMGGLQTDESVWLTSTWELYERWCFTEVVRLISAFAGGGYTNRRFGADRTWRGVMADGRVAWVLLQPSFPAFDAASGVRLRSISGRRVPDVIVLVGTESDCRALILDAKYCRARASILDAMASAHLYHDALRVDGGRPELALLVVPAPTECRWLESEEFIAAQGVGVVVAAPGQEAAPLAEVLTAFLKPA